MANPEHLAKLKDGVASWNSWLGDTYDILPDLRNATLRGAQLQQINLALAHLSGVDFSGANLNGADLRDADLVGAKLWVSDLTKANLCEANLFTADLRGSFFGEANLRKTNLIEADLRSTHFAKADLSGALLTSAILRDAFLSKANLNGVDLDNADLTRADLSGANLSGADLRRATLVETNLKGANLTACSVYGISAWNVQLEGAIQSELVITTDDESPIQVDNLEVAQFIYLLLNNEKIRDVIDTITSKVVLILGRFTPNRIALLQAIRKELRNREYSPVLFDFEKPSSQTTVETISTLAHMARFVIADLTDAKSVLQELQAIVPQHPSVVVQPLLLASQEEPGMFDFIRQFPWVLNTYRYPDENTLLVELEEKVINPAAARAKLRVKQ
jgi:uncharacterized protein YjbI with pentapeptide repeats